MARNIRRINALPAKVFEVLLDPESYGHWVVGSRATLRVDENWPAPGSAFYHSSGVGPTQTKDQTKVLEIDAPRRLLLEAYFRPFGVMRIHLSLTPSNGGTSVTMEEGPARGTTLSRISPLVSPIIHLRNKESLRRLEQLATQRSGES